MIWFIIFVGTLFLFILSLKHPVILAVTVVFFTPLLSGMSRGTIVPFFRPNELLLLSIFLIYVLRNIMFVHRPSYYSININFVDKGFLILFLGTGVIPIVKTLYVSRGLSLDALFPYLSVIQYYLFYKVVSGTIKTKKDLRAVVYAFIIAGMIVSSLAILEALRVTFVEDLLWNYYPSAHLMKAQKYSRVASILGSWAALGAFCIIQILFSVLMFIRHKELISTGVLYLYIGLSVLALVPSVTLAPTIGLFIGGLYLLLIKKFRRYLVFLVLVIGVSAWLFWPFIQNRVNFQFGGSGIKSGNLVPRTFSQRIMLWSDVYLPVIRRNLLLGYGLDISTEISRGISTTTQESQYIGLLYQSGLVGLAAHLAYVLTIYQGLSKVRKTKTWQARMCADNKGQETMGLQPRRIYVMNKDFNKVFAEVGMLVLVILSIIGIANAYFTYSGVAESLWFFYSLSVSVCMVPSKNSGIYTRNGMNLDF